MARRTSKTTRKKSSKSKKGGQSPLKRLPPIALLLFIGFILVYSLVTGGDPMQLLNESGLFDGAGNQGGQIESTHQAIEGSAGDWWQVYFTDPLVVNDPDNLQGSVAEKLIARIDQAQDTIHIASFEFNYTPVAEALIEADKRGVEILWVTDDEHGLEADEEEDHGQFAMLEKAGIKIKDDARSGLMHDKFWIFDDKTVWTGSTNITVNGMFRNNNNVIVIESPDVATMYEREFQEMWAGEFGRTSTSTVDQQSTVVQGTPVEVLFAGEDHVSDRLAELLDTAQGSIRFMAFSFTDEQMGETILSRASTEVKVQGIFETRGSETEYSEMPKFYCAGLAVRQDGNPRTFHHKVLIIDNKTVVTGSYNFSKNADESNDENLVIMTNADIAAAYIAEFERRWTEAKIPEAADMNCR